MCCNTHLQVAIEKLVSLDLQVKCLKPKYLKHSKYIFQNNNLNHFTWYLSKCCTLELFTLFAIPVYQSDLMTSLHNHTIKSRYGSKIQIPSTFKFIATKWFYDQPYINNLSCKLAWKHLLWIYTQQKMTTAGQTLMVKVTKCTIQRIVWCDLYDKEKCYPINHNLSQYTVWSVWMSSNFVRR